MKTYTTLRPRSLDEEATSREYVFVGDVQYKHLQDTRPEFDHKLIHGNSYGVDVGQIEEAKKNGIDLLMNVFPNPEFIAQIKSHFQIEVKTIYIKTKMLTTARRLRAKRSPEEFQRLRTEVRTGVDEVIEQMADATFVPENSLEKDLTRIEEMEKSVLERQRE